MRHIWIVIFALALVLTTFSALNAQDAGREFMPGEILLGWRPGIAACDSPDQIPTQPGISTEACRLLADLSPSNVLPEEPLAEQRGRPEWQAATHSLAALTGLDVYDLWLSYGVARLQVTPGSEAAEIARLSKLPWVLYVEPNYLVRAAGRLYQARFPNDPLIGQQWNMRRVYAPEAWGVTQGSYSMIVAVLDSGIDQGHPEFSYRLMPGYDYVNNDNIPNDDYGHGTHVAGLIAANANNSIGISGLAPNVKLLPHKVLNSAGEGTHLNVAAALIDAANASAQIINLSLGDVVSSTTLQNAVGYAQTRGALVVAAAGNYGQSGNPDYYPARYPGVLAVGASDHYDNWASYSGYKPYVGLAAPGGIAADRVLSTAPGGYSYLYGTSMATPLVSAAAALVWTMQPAATAQQVADILKNTADKVGSEPYVGGHNNYFGHGRLNVARAVRMAYPPSLTPSSSVQRLLTSNPMQSSVREVALLNPSEQAISWQAMVTQGAEWLSVFPASGQTAYSNPGNLVLLIGPVARPPGIYTGTVRVVSSVTTFDMRVELRVVAQLYRANLPTVLQDWYGISWLDPFAPNAPAPQILPLADNSAHLVPLPFPVTFYGQTYWDVSVSDNGLVWFGAGTSASLQPPTTCLPSAAAPNNAIYVLALDWRPALGGQVYAHRPDQDTFVITWRNVQRPWLAIPQSFQLVLRRTGEIAVSYQTIEALPPAIIGAENDDGTVAEQIYCNGAGRLPSSGDSFRLRALLPWQ